MFLGAGGRRFSAGDDLADKNRALVSKALPHGRHRNDPFGGHSGKMADFFFFVFRLALAQGYGRRRCSTSAGFQGASEVGGRAAETLLERLVTGAHFSGVLPISTRQLNPLRTFSK